MMIWLGGFGGGIVASSSPGVVSPPWRVYLSLNDISDPGPGRMLLFWDQREDSINWGNFFVDMTGFPGWTTRPVITMAPEDCRSWMAMPKSSAGWM